MKFGEHNCSQMGAALAYYTLFSFIPLLILSIGMAGMVYGAEAAERKVHELLSSYVEADNAELIMTALRSTTNRGDHYWVSLISLIVTPLAALQLFLHMRNAFCVIWDISPPKKNSILGTILNFILAIVMVLCAGILLGISLGISTVISVLESHMNWPAPGLWSLVDVIASFLYLGLIFVTLFWILSARAISFGYVLYGSVICTILFIIGKYVLALYLTLTTAPNIYGAAGTLVGFLIWIFYSSQLIFFGAELIQARRTRKDWMRK